MRLMLLVLIAAAGCRCGGPTLPTTPGDGAPELSVVESMKDPYDGLPARGSVPPVERAASVLQNAGSAFGCGPEAASSLRRHAKEAWVDRLILFIDHGGDEQVTAAWLDLHGTALASTRVGPEAKLKLRQAEARVVAEQHEGRSMRHLRRRYLAEVAWLMTVLDKEYR
jgi:hypothetical protein